MVLSSIIPSVPVVNQSTLYINDLKLEWIDQNSARILAGAARDSFDINDITLSETLVIDLRISGLLGIDVGVVEASKQYAVYLLGDSTGYKSTSVIVSLDSSSPIIPVGYDMFRRVGWMCTGSGTELMKFYQYGIDVKRSYYYDVGDSADTIRLSGGSSATFAEVPNLELAIPPIKTEVIFRAEYNQGLVTNTADFLPYVAVPRRLANGIISIGFGSLTEIQYSQVIVPCDLNPSGNPSVLYKVGAGDTLSLIVVGFRDYL